MKMYAIYAIGGERVAHIPAVVGDRLIKDGIAVKGEHDASDEYTIAEYHLIKKSGHTIVLHSQFKMVEVDSEGYE